MAIDPELIYIEILETVLMATLDPDLWKSALQKLALHRPSVRGISVLR
jgi:hypothetical protein